MLNPMDYGSDLSSGITTIQNGATGTGAASRPLHIFIPPGMYTLTSPIIITRHNVTLDVDAGATIYIPTGISGLQLDGSLNADGHLKHLAVRVNGRIEGQTGSVDGIHCKSVIHSDLFFNEVRWTGRDGIRLEGSCFSNRILVNRVHGTIGWNLNCVGSLNSTYIDGEFAFSNAGGLRLNKTTGCVLRVIVENQQTTNNIGLLLDGARDNRISGWFEGNDGTDLVIQATDQSSFNNLIEPPTGFYSTPAVGENNIALINGTFGVSRTHIGPINIYSTVRGLSIGSGVTDTWLHETEIVSGSISDASAAGQTHYTRPLTGSITWDPSSLADGAGITSSPITVSGAAFGYRVEVAASYDLQGIICTGYVSAANTVKIRLQNETGGTIDLASGTWRVIVRRD